MGNAESAKLKPNVTSVSKQINNPHQGKVRVIHLLKHPKNGYGCYLRTFSNMPGEFIADIEVGGSAEIAGLYEYDRVVAVNGISISNVSHTRVVSMIKSKQSQVVLTVIDEDANKNFLTSAPNTSDDIVAVHGSTIRIVTLRRDTVGGYGMLVKAIEAKSRFHILSDVYTNGVAWKSGLRDGDVLLAVNGNVILSEDESNRLDQLWDEDDSLSLTVCSFETGEFLMKFNVEVTNSLLNEWPTQKEYNVPSFWGFDIGHTRTEKEMKNRTNVSNLREQTHNLGRLNECFTEDWEEDGEAKLCRSSKPDCDAKY